MVEERVLPRTMQGVMLLTLMLFSQVSSQVTEVKTTKDASPPTTSVSSQVTEVKTTKDASPPTTSASTEPITESTTKVADTTTTTVMASSGVSSAISPTTPTPEQCSGANITAIERQDQNITLQIKSNENCSVQDVKIKDKPTSMNVTFDNETLSIRQIFNLEPCTKYTINVVLNCSTCNDTMDVEVETSYPATIGAVKFLNSSSVYNDETELVNLRLFWEVPTAWTKGNCTELKYNITCKGTADPLKEYSKYGSPDNSWVFNNVTANMDYNCSVVVFGYNRTSDPNLIQQKTEVGKSSEPRSLKANPKGTNTTYGADLTWEEPSTKNGEIKEYRVNLINATTMEETVVRCDAMNESFTTCELKNLKPFTKYNVTVHAITKTRDGHEIHGGNATTTFISPEGIPSEPRGLKVRAIKDVDNAFIVSWKEPYSLNGKLRHYKIHICIREKCNDFVYNLQNNLQKTFENLHYSTKYEIKVSAHNEFKGVDASTSFITSYNSKLTIGLMAFFICLVIVVLLFMAFKMLKAKGLLISRNGYSIQIPMPIREPTLLEVQPILAEELQNVYETKAASDFKTFQQEFESIPRVWKSNPSKEAQQPYNNGKNRYSDILPYDHNRVRLVSNGGKPGSDYINASYINGYKENKKYICAQGPMEETAADFWGMIWEQKTAVIIMVTRCIEGGKNKCYQYWPRQSGKKLQYKSLSVTNNEVMQYPDYVITKISLNHGGNSRTITHVQFTKWPDHGVPDDPDLLLRLRRRVLSFCNFFDGPMVVHCSAGVGRTGTFVAINSLMEMLEDEGRVDVYAFVVTLRQQRCLMVQVEDQYILIHQVLLEQQLYGDTEISLAELRTILPSLLMRESVTEPSSLELEFQKVPDYEEMQNVGTSPANINNNRSKHAIAYDYNRVKLKRMEEYGEHESDCEDEDDNDESDDESEDYINASYLNGYHALGTFIATQGPLQNTLAQFWHMVFQKDCHNIVMLTELTEDGVEQCYQYWPEKDAHTYGEVEVQLMETEKPNEELTVRRFNIKCKQKCREVRQFQIHSWRGKGVPSSNKGLIEIIKTIQMKQEIFGFKRPIVVHCSDGAERTGTFCALWNILESGRMEGMVDVFQTVKKLRLQRPAMIKTLDHYRFCYETVVKVIKVQNGVPASTTSKQSPDSKTPDEVVVEIDDVPDASSTKQQNNIDAPENAGAAEDKKKRQEEGIENESENKEKDQEIV
uniref:receptor-type tyrosine-protein phosphatase C n=1 Tax=Myxine glutinosa TaxID=7769 RepID=UPI00358EB0F1